MRCLVVVLIFAPLVYAGEAVPRITSIANAASFYRPPTDPNQPGLGVAGGSIIAIFGENLSYDTSMPVGFPLPMQLADTSVTIGGIAAPLFYVSPTQINAMVPSAVGFRALRRGDFRTVPVEIKVGSQSSESQMLRITAYGLGIFTLDSSGCGQGLVYQQDADGSISLNGPENSADPGKSILTVIATGAGLLQPGLPVPPDGEPTSSRFHATSAGPGPFLLDPLRWDGAAFSQRGVGTGYDAGRLVNAVATDFSQFRLSEQVPDGCAIPLRLVSDHTPSQNVTIAIRRGGGRCVDPPVQSIAVLTWEREVTSGVEPQSVREALRLEFLAAPGKELPVRDTVADPDTPVVDPRTRQGGEHGFEDGPSCPLPTDTRLHAGQIIASGPGWGPISVEPGESNLYRIGLPPNAIRQGTFTVRGGGGNDVGPFETSIEMPAPIQPEDVPPGTRIPAYRAAGGYPRFRWSGGDAASWVRVGVHSNPVRPFPGPWALWNDRIATLGAVQFFTLDFYGLAPTPEAEVIFTQDAMNPVKFEAPGLTHGGLHRYFYRWRYAGAVVTE